MIDLAAQVLNLTHQGFMIVFAVFLRVGAMVSVMPGFGEQNLSSRVKLGAALAFTAVVAPAVSPQLAHLPHDVSLGLILPETAIGLSIGVIMRMFIYGLQMAGMIIAQATSLAQIFGAGGESQPAVGFMLTTAGLALAFAMGLHVQAAELMIGSYKAFPFGQFPAPDLIREWGVAGVAKSFRLGFSIAAPFVILGLVYNAALGVINRAMPQLMVAMIGAPAITLAGIVLMAIALPTGLIVWREAFGSFLFNPFSVMR
ncbi:flagellar biosynthetic protein FliR [Thioclava sp. GXIMD4215]|uniref:flagellar biosynthetic protein FliR n=1 Tax=Thioclava sp. GXIMD4215 TaxID=3131928 RepID=UPI00324421FB